jgi:hypothetical protein
MEFADESNRVPLQSARQDFPIDARLDILAEFELADSLHREFSRQYLRQQLFADLAGDDFAEAVGLADLEATDQALLAYVGLAELPARQPLIVFVQPELQLLAIDLVALGGGWHRAELYFVARERISVDYTVAIRVATETLQTASDEAADYMVFDFEPHQPTTSWAPNQIVAAAKRIYCPEPIVDLKLGMYLHQVGAARYLPLTGSPDSLVSFPPSVIGNE